MYTVYFALNRRNGKAYAGYTRFTARRRFQNHCSSAIKGSCMAFHNALRKHGKELFDVITVWQGTNKQEALQVEIDCIAGMKLQDKRFGYNLSPGGESGALLGHPVSDDTKRKIGDANRGHKHTNEFRKLKANQARGNQSHLGHSHSDATKERIRASAIRRWQGENNE